MAETALFMSVHAWKTVFFSAMFPGAQNVLVPYFKFKDGPRKNYSSGKISHFVGMAI